MSTQIERYVEPPLALIQSVDDLARLSKQVADSKYYDKTDNAAQASVKLMIARELGLGLTSISNIHLVKGKISLGYQIMIALVKRSGKYDMRFVERTDERVKIEWFEDGQSVGFSKFDLKDAQNAGIKGDMYAKFPVRMLTARAVSDGFNTFAPECAGGALYSLGELDDEPEPAPRRKRERAAATTNIDPPKGETIVDAEVISEAPVAPETAESRVAPEDESASLITPDPVKVLTHVLKQMDWEQRKLVKQRCSEINIVPDQKPAELAADLIAYFASDDEGLLSLLKADANGEMPSAERFEEFIAPTGDATLEDVREAMAAAGEFGS